MEDLFQIVFFALIFIVGPLLEHMRKKGQEKQQQKPPSRVPSEAPRVPPAPSRTEEVSRREPEPQSAAEMLPDELWEILTGQKRPTPTPVPPRPAPPTRYEEEEPNEEDELVEVGADDIRTPAEVVGREERSLETYERHEVPVVVSMETLPPPPRVRHEEFHRRIATPVAAAAKAAAPKAAAPTRSTTAAGRLTALARRGTLRDVIVLQDILGRPKGLE